jgi:ribonuclease HIII
VLTDSFSGRTRIGTDETGKGDYFGDLVVAGVWADRQVEDTLAGLGVCDSKRLSDNRARELAERIEDLCPVEVVRISPPTYNRLYEKMGNLNKLLAWGHARVLENLLAKVNADLAVCDQFGDERYVREALMKQGRQIELVQKTGGESDLAVAAASIVARATFLSRLACLSREVGVKLPKGALHIHGAARELYQRGGLELLGQVAKLHFKTTKQVIHGAAAPETR